MPGDPSQRTASQAAKPISGLYHAKQCTDPMDLIGDGDDEPVPIYASPSHTLTTHQR
jgi:hypothetical protein